MTPKDLPELTDEQIAELSIEFIAMVPPDFDYVGFGRKCYDLGARSTAAQPVERWIPVAERFPGYDEELEVLCFSESHTFGGSEHFCTLKATDFYEFDPDGDGEPGTPTSKCITHWMPRPWPPSIAAASGDSTPPSEPVQGDSIGAPRPEPEAAVRDRVVGHKTFSVPGGGFRHEPLLADEADRLMAAVREADRRRAELMPDEQAAIRMLFEAYQRLRELGWGEAIYCPKDGSEFDAIEPGSTGIHRCHYSGEWPNGRWWIAADGDLWPSRPVLFRRHATPEPPQAASVERGD